MKPVSSSECKLEPSSARSLNLHVIQKSEKTKKEEEERRRSGFWELKGICETHTWTRHCGFAKMKKDQPPKGTLISHQLDGSKKRFF